MFFRLNIIIALFFMTSFLFVNAGLFGVGSSFFLFFIILSIKIIQTLLSGKFTLARCNKKVFLLYIVYVCAAAISLLIVNVPQETNVRLLFSLSLISIWFLILPSIHTKVGSELILGIRRGAFITSVAILFIWGAAGINSGDFFIIRSMHNDSWLMLNSMFSNPNLAARVSFLLLVILLYFAAESEGRRKVFFFLSLLVSLLILSSMSRANIISTLFVWGLWCVLLLSRKKMIVMLSVFSISLVLITMFNHNLYDRFVSVSDYSFFSDENRRSRTWNASYSIFIENPYFGIGKYSELEEYRKHGSFTSNTAQKGKVITTHGGFLKVIVYTGFIGLVAFLLFYIALFSLFFKNYKNNSSDKTASAMGMITLIGLIPMNLGADAFGLSITWFVIALFLKLIQKNNYTKLSMSRA
jgi:O-antigen ligase